MSLTTLNALQIELGNYRDALACAKMDGNLDLADYLQECIDNINEQIAHFKG